MTQVVNRIQFLKEFDQILQRLLTPLIYSNQHLKSTQDEVPEDLTFFLVDITGEVLDFDSEIPARCVAAEVKIEYASNTENMPELITITSFNQNKNSQQISDLANKLSSFGYSVVLFYRRDMYIKPVI
jgi:hypothetical protein